jgi:predicted Na+-dependent transporter
MTQLLPGMVLQYTVLPSIGWAISRFWGLQASLAIGVALVSGLQWRATGAC